jgi:hypothetical protein
MIQSLMYINKQMRYKVVLLIQLNDVQQAITECKTNKSTMYIKHAIACALEFFSFFLSFFILFVE